MSENQLPETNEEEIDRSLQPKSERLTRGIFRRTRAGIVLTYGQVAEIKAKRKELKEELKESGVYNKQDFQQLAVSKGYYFDKGWRGGILAWLFHGRVFGLLLTTVVAALTVTYFVSKVTERQGHFTLNLTEEMMEEGFELSFDKEFTVPRSALYADSITFTNTTLVSGIPQDVDGTDGQHNGANYFACTFYLRHTGKKNVNFTYSLKINSESKNISSALWAMLFQDGEMSLYAKQGSDGNAEYLRDTENPNRAYPYFEGNPLYALINQAADPSAYVIERGINEASGHPLIWVGSTPFESEKTIVSGLVENVVPDEVHKFTVVFWLEGWDPDCVYELIGGHAGLQMDFALQEISE